MEDKVESLKELKRVLLSLVCSNPARMDVNCLKRDFAETERDGRIPIHKYGYKDLIMFLKSECRDIFQFDGNPHNPFLVPIVTKEIKTLNELVVKQKTVNSKAHLVKRSRGIPSHVSGRNDQWSTGNNYNMANNYYSNTKPPISYVRPQNSQTSYQPSESPKKPIPPLMTETGPRNPKINGKVTDNLRDLIAAYSDGLWTRELLKAYERKYNIDLPLERLGYNSVISLCKDLPQIFKVVRPDHLGDWRLFSVGATIPDQYKDNSVSSNKYSRRNDEEDNRPTDCEVEIFGIAALPGVGFDASLYPKDCAGYGVCLPVPPELASCLKVLVAEVQDPSHFWFQVDSADTSVALDLLMDQMDDVYLKSPTSHLMVRAAARVGQLCAVPYCGRYHRAIVVKNISYETVKVRYADYGTVSDIAASDLRMLLLEFTKLAVQAYRGRLAGVRPLSARWGLQARSYFLRAVSDKQLEAEVVHKDEKESVYELKLFEWDDTSRRSVDTKLLDEGLAVSIGTRSMGANSTIYLLPTFVDLENGKSPDEESENESKVTKDMIVSRVAEEDASQSEIKLQGVSCDDSQSDDDIENGNVKMAECEDATVQSMQLMQLYNQSECEDATVQSMELDNQSECEDATVQSMELDNQSECKDATVQSMQRMQLDNQSISMVLVSEHHRDKMHIENQSIPVLVSECSGDVHSDNASVQSVDDVLDVRPNLEPEIREIVRLSNLRNSSRPVFDNDSRTFMFPSDSRFFNGSHIQYSHPPNECTSYAMNQYAHNYPERPGAPPDYAILPGGPPHYFHSAGPPSAYPELSRMPPHYSDLSRMQPDYWHMSGFPDSSRMPAGPPDYGHYGRPSFYAPPYNQHGFYPNFSHTLQNTPRVPPPGFVRRHHYADSQYSAANSSLRPMHGQFHNTKPVRPPRLANKPYNNSFQEITDKLSDVSLFNSSSIVEKSQCESNTGNSKNNVNESTKLNGITEPKKLERTIDSSLNIVSTDDSENKNSVKSEGAEEPVFHQGSDATDYRVDDSDSSEIRSSEYSSDLNDDSRLPWYKLELIDVGDISGRPVEVWHYKDGVYAVLQQAARSVVDEGGNRTLVNSIVGCAKGGIEGPDHHIIQDEFIVCSIMRSIEKSGRTPYSLGQEIKIMTKKHISLEDDYIILVPLMSLLDVFCIVRENFLVEMSDLMKFVISMLKKHSVEEESDDNDDSDD